MNIEIVKDFLKNINRQLWMLLGLGFILLTILIIFSSLKKIDSDIIGYLSLVYIINFFLSLFVATRNNFLAYMIALASILVEIMGAILIFLGQI